MATLRLERPGDRPLRCYARRGRSGTVRCEQEALHYISGAPLHQVHAGRDRAGRWHFWPTVLERTFICQVNHVNTSWLECPEREAVFQCEAQGPHGRHMVGWHTMMHDWYGNGHRCEMIERCERERTVP